MKDFDIKAFVIRVVCILFAITMIAVAVNMFLGPHQIAAGGLTGFAIILEAWIGMDRATIVLIGNAIVIVATLFFLGKEFFLNTAIGAGSLPFIMAAVPHERLVNDAMLSMLVGSVLFGLGVALLYKNNASSGGTAVPPLIFKKYFNLRPSIGLFLCDGAVVILSLFIFDVDSFFYAIFSILVTMAVMGYIETGLSRKKRVHIISKFSDLIVKDIMSEIGKSVTIINTVGSYEKQEMPMLMVTFGSSDYKKLIEIVDRHDKQAFLVTDIVSDVHGRGFTYGSGSV